MIKTLLIMSLLGVDCIPIKKICKMEASIEPSNQRSYSKRQTSYENLLIDIVFTVFHNNENGKVSNNILKNQISVLNDAFSGKYSKQSMKDTNIRFKLNKINYINNKE